MHRLVCGEIWGGFRNCNEDVVSAGVTATLYSSSSEGGRGGDIYYLGLCENNALTRMVVADVVGHGETVSKVSKYIYEAIKSHMNDTKGDELLSELNRTTYKRGLDVMTTVAMVTFYKFDGNLYFAYAGHPPVLFRQNNTPDWIELKASSRNPLPLAVDPSTVYLQKSIEVNQGDSFILYTDGLTEAFNGENEVFGLNRLKAFLSKNADRTPSKLKEMIMKEVCRFAGGSLSHDDVTIMIAEIGETN
jgi:sigma-B regulation protein RsbU (phosphoserine phosphatase)